MGMVRVTATLDSPVVLSDDLHLDGLLMSAHPMMRQRALSRETPVADLVLAPIPVCRATARSVTTYLCTAAQLPPEARATTEYATKRRDTEALVHKVHLGLGPGKNRLIQLPVVVTPHLWWHAIGSPREIVHLLRRVTHIGAWRSAGYGHVTAWSAAYVDGPPEAVLTHEGRAMRHLPAAWVTWAGGLTTGAVIPPYWHPGRQTASIVRAGTLAAIEDSVVALVRALADPAAHRAHKLRHQARAEARQTRAAEAR